VRHPITLRERRVNDLAAHLVGAFLGVLVVVVLARFQRRRPRTQRLLEARDAQREVQAILAPHDVHALSELLESKGPLEVRGKSRVYEGSKLRSGRRATVTLWGGGRLDSAPRVTVTLEAPNTPRVSIRRKGRHEGFWSAIFRGRRRDLDFGNYLVTSLDEEQARRAFAHTELARDLEGAFAAGIESLLLWDGKLVAQLGHVANPSQVAEQLERLDRIASDFDPIAIQVRVLGGERLALRGASGGARCSYCHDSITGEEPDLVACGRCHTVLHEGCWQELGRCPVLGCDGHEPERRSARAEPVT
jgi:hypothetical protein